jgi:hypothetical protein
LGFGAGAAFSEVCAGLAAGAGVDVSGRAAAVEEAPGALALTFAGCSNEMTSRTATNAATPAMTMYQSLIFCQIRSPMVPTPRLIVVLVG